MKEIIKSKKDLEVVLSGLKDFDAAKVSSEQYSTPSAIAGEILWSGLLKEEIKGKVIVDLGCGTGVLGIGALLLGAKRVIFVDNDGSALSILKENIAKVLSEDWDIGEYDIREADARLFQEKVDTAITNPPFGTRNKGVDKEFLKTCMHVADVTYSFHKTSTIDHIISYVKSMGGSITEEFEFDFMLRNTMNYHTKNKEYILVTVLHIVSNGNDNPRL